MHYQQAILDDLRPLIVKICQRHDIPFDPQITPLSLDIPKDRRFGDLSANIGMILAKIARRSGREVAELLLPAFAQLPYMASCEIAGGGFINMRLEESFWQDHLREILRQDDLFGETTRGASQKVVLEYVSANPTGPLHIGHLRGAIFGDVLAALLANCGFEVTREYYINDSGAQIEILVESFKIRYREVCGETVGPLAEGLYPGDYLKEAAKDFYSLHQDRFLHQLNGKDEMRTFILDWVLKGIQKDLMDLGIHMDSWVSEATLLQNGTLEEFLEACEKKGLVYTGTLPPPKGKVPDDDWEPTPQLLFKASTYGDTIDRPLKKSDGSWTYMATDAAYHLNKWHRGHPINIWGADHGGYIKRIEAVLKALTNYKEPLEVFLCAMVRLLRKGTAEKMSKRAGNFVTVRSLLEEVGSSALRFSMLSRKNSEPLDFDPQLTVQQSRENPIFYVQYAYARIHSVLKQARRLIDEEGIYLTLEPSIAYKENFLGLLELPQEQDLVRQLVDFPRFIEQAAYAREPHRLYYYLMETASLFHNLWTQGTQNAEARFLISQNPSLTNARIGLLLATRIVFKKAFRLVGIDPLETLFSQAR